MPSSARQRPDWLLSHYPLPVPPDRSVSQRDFCGWPGLEPQQLVAPPSSSQSTSHRRKSTGHWMSSCYDDVGRRSERVPNHMIYRDDYKRLPVHPWHYWRACLNEKTWEKTNPSNLLFLFSISFLSIKHNPHKFFSPSVFAAKSSRQRQERLRK